MDALSDLLDPLLKADGRVAGRSEVAHRRAGEVRRHRAHDLEHRLQRRRHREDAATREKGRGVDLPSCALVVAVAVRVTVVARRLRVHDVAAAGKQRGVAHRRGRRDVDRIDRQAAHHVVRIGNRILLTVDLGWQRACHLALVVARGHRQRRYGRLGIGADGVADGGDGLQVGVDRLDVVGRHPSEARPRHHDERRAGGGEVLARAERSDELRLGELHSRGRIGREVSRCHLLIGADGERRAAAQELERRAGRVVTVAATDERVHDVAALADHLDRSCRLARRAHRDGRDVETVLGPLRQDHRPTWRAALSRCARLAARTRCACRPRRAGSARRSGRTRRASRSGDAVRSVRSVGPVVTGARRDRGQDHAANQCIRHPTIHRIPPSSCVKTG